MLIVTNVIVVFVVALVVVWVENFVVFVATGDGVVVDVAAGAPVVAFLGSVVIVVVVFDAAQ